jgi:hypothetical protein
VWAVGGFVVLGPPPPPPPPGPPTLSGRHLNPGRGRSPPPLAGPPTAVSAVPGRGPLGGYFNCRYFDAK